MLQEVNQDQIKTKAKRENEKGEESQTGFILLAHTKITTPSRYTFFFFITKGFYLLTIFVKEF